MMKRKSNINSRPEGACVLKKVWRAFTHYIKHSDMLLLFLCIASTLYGVVLISSATRSYGTTSNVKIQLAALVIGVLLYVLLSIIDIEIIASKWRWIFAFNILFIATLFVWGQAGDTINRGWLRFGPIGVQPAEIVKITFIIVFATQMNYFRSYKDLNSFVSFLLLALHFLLMFGLIVLSSSDLGSAMVYLFIFIVMLFAGGLKLRWFLVGIAVLAVGIPLLWTKFLHDYQKERILAPYVASIDPEGLGVRWHAIQSQIAIAGGGFTGQGLYSGARVQTEYLPSKHTDFIFSVAGEELGFVGCLAIFLLLAAIIARCVYVGVKSRDYLSSLICFGIAGMLIFQVLENIGMCLGLTPVVGLTLPFFSYGGSSIITMFAAMGIVSGIKLRPKPERYRRL